MEAPNNDWTSCRATHLDQVELLSRLHAGCAVRAALDAISGQLAAEGCQVLITLLAGKEEGTQARWSAPRPEFGSEILLEASEFAPFCVRFVFSLGERRDPGT